MVTKLFKKKVSLSSGFTLIELVVILAIFATMSSILLFNFRGFNKNIERNNLAQDIGLLIRKAQSYGTTSSTLTAGNLMDTNTVALRYGLIFDYSGTTNTIESIVLYKKLLGGAAAGVGFTDNSGIVVPGNSGTGVADVIILDTIRLNSPGVTVAVCNQVNGSVCGSIVNNDVAIEFERPKPDPYTSLSGINSSSLRIRVLPSDTLVPWYIVVAPTGNIYVKQN